LVGQNRDSEHVAAGGGDVNVIANDVALAVLSFSFTASQRQMIFRNLPTSLAAFLDHIAQLQTRAAVACFVEDCDALLALHQVQVRDRIRVRTTNLAEPRPALSRRSHRPVEHEKPTAHRGMDPACFTGRSALGTIAR
jgi:hypothetical protein